MLNLAGEIDLKRNDKYVASSNIITYCRWKNVKSYIKTINLKYELQLGIINLNYLPDIEYIIKNYETLTENPQLHLKIRLDII